MPARLRSAIWTAAWIGCWLGAFTLTHIPIESRGVERLPHADKLAHFSMYFGICYLGGLRLQIGSKLARTAVWSWALVYLAYGALDEITQPLTGRDADLADWVFDALGIAVSTAALWLGFVPKFAKNSGPANVTVD